MQKEEELLFAIDDDARWMGELTLLLFSWTLLALFFWYFEVDVTNLLHSVQGAPVWLLALISVAAAYIVVYTVGSLLKVVLLRNRRDRKILFYSDRIVISISDRTFHIEEFDEGFFLSMILTGDYARVNTREGRYRKYLLALLSPLLFAGAVAGKLASLSACVAYLLKYGGPVPVKAVLFPYLSLVNRRNERIVLMVTGPNREKVLDYLRYYLYTDPASLPKHFAVLPEKTRNLEPQINARNMTMKRRNLDAWEWYRGNGLNVTTEMGE